MERGQTKSAMKGQTLRLLDQRGPRSDYVKRSSQFFNFSNALFDPKHPALSVPVPDNISTHPRTLQLYTESATGLIL